MSWFSVFSICAKCSLFKDYQSLKKEIQQLVKN